MHAQLKTVAALGFLTLLASPAQAISKSYTLGPDSSVSANSGAGLIIQTDLSNDLNGYSFSLDDNQSETIPFFQIWTEETTVNYGEDTLAKPITATLDFYVPDMDATVSGVTFGGTIRVFGVDIFQWGVVEWNGPVSFDAGDRIFTVELNDATFGLGAFRLGTDPAWINATITQTSSTAVPDASSTLALFGIALTGLAAFRRKV